MRYIFALAFSFLIVLCAFAQNSSPVPGGSGYGAGKNPNPLNGNNTLGLTYTNTTCGLNYIMVNQMIQKRTAVQTPPFNVGGTGLPTTLTVAGIPTCATILKAYVWYIVSYIGATPQASSVVITNPASTTTTTPAPIIGTSAPKCWGEKGTANYRADVTSAISGNGNYGLNITGITGTSTNFPLASDQIDGVTLFIIYKDNGATYQGSLVIWDGCHTCDANTGCSAFTQTMTGVNACGASTSGKAFLIVSDMQSNVNGGNHPSTLNGATANYPNTFWCVDQVNTTVTSGQASANFGTNGLGGDCFDWMLMGLYYQTTSCTTCVPAAISVTVTPTPSSCGAPNGSAVAAVSGTAPYTYSWTPGGQTTSSINNLSAGTYSVSVTDATGCSSVQTCTITSSVGPAVSFVSVPVKCKGASNGSATLTATGGSTPYTYAWVTTPVQTSPTANNLAAGTYSVVVSDASGCSATYTVAVTEPTALTATATVLGNVSCAGSTDGSATSGGAGGTSPYSYAWSPGGQNTQTATSLAAGGYSVIVTDANGCTASQSVNITQPIAIALTQTSVMASCAAADGSATITATNGSGAYTYLWLTTPVQTTQTISNLSAGTYNVLVTDANGCSSQMAVTIATSGKPTAAFTNSPDTVDLLDAQVFFTDLSTGGASTWVWNFGDPNDPTGSTVQNPSHTYSDTGIYCITLIVTDPGGICSDTTVHCLKVESPFTFYIPNTFTPNMDGNNEIFTGYGTYIKTFHILIFDRWGNLIFESKDINKGWDGKVQNGHSGRLVQEDVYVWKVSVTDFNDKVHNYIGHVNMIR
jgi:gliding motility-associated-like protein